MIRSRIARILIASTLVSVLPYPTALAATSAEGLSDALPIGAAAPDFALPDVTTGRTVSLADFAGKKAMLVIVLCRHCPFVRHALPGIAAVGRDYAGKDLGIVGISANDPADYPEDSPESLKEMAALSGIVFPILFDGTQEVAKAYTAVATPDFFLFDADRRLVYRGQLDGTRPGSAAPVTGEDLRAAIDAVLDGRPVEGPQKPSVGCSIKWKRAA